jgi:Ser/Thr protein kinase RdoA (MazF antagonist)
MSWAEAERWFQRYERQDAAAGGRLLRYWEETRKRLAGLVPHAPAPMVIHGDVVPWNLRYRQGTLSGLLDFDLTHVDFRVADFALAWRGRHDGVLQGYQEVARLEPVEQELVVPVYWAWVLASAACTIRDGRSLSWELGQLARQPLDVRVPLTA